MLMLLPTSRKNSDFVERSVDTALRETLGSAPRHHAEIPAGEGGGWSGVGSIGRRSATVCGMKRNRRDERERERNFYDKKGREG